VQPVQFPNHSGMPLSATLTVVDMISHSPMYPRDRRNLRNRRLSARLVEAVQFSSVYPCFAIPSCCAGRFLELHMLRQPCDQCVRFPLRLSFKFRVDRTMRTSWSTTKTLVTLVRLFTTNDLCVILCGVVVKVFVSLPGSVQDRCQRMHQT
jgi:hypothetical protein